MGMCHDGETLTVSLYDLGLVSVLNTGATDMYPMVELHG